MSQDSEQGGVLQVGAQRRRETRKEAVLKKILPQLEGNRKMVTSGSREGKHTHAWTHMHTCVGTREHMHTCIHVNVHICAHA